MILAASTSLLGWWTRIKMQVSSIKGMKFPIGITTQGREIICMVSETDNKMIHRLYVCGG